MPHKMPIPRGRSAVASAFVDASHGANKVTRISNSGYVLVEEHRSLGGSIISRLDNGAFVGLIYELLVFS